MPSSIMIAWRSEPPSICTSPPNGYGPGIALVVVVEVDRDLRMRRGHDVERDPVGGRAEVRVQPGGARVRRTLPRAALADGSGASGCPCSTTLFAGKTEHAVPGTSAAPAGIEGTAESTSAAAAADSARIRFTSRVSAAAAAPLSRERREARRHPTQSEADGCGGGHLLRLRHQARRRTRTPGSCRRPRP